MENFLVAWDKNSLYDSSYDFILISEDIQKGNFSLPDYQKQKIDSYVLFKKI
jgi:hypothetical protein